MRDVGLENSHLTERPNNKYNVFHKVPSPAARNPIRDRRQGLRSLTVFLWAAIALH